MEEDGRRWKRKEEEGRGIEAIEEIDRDRDRDRDRKKNIYQLKIK